MTTATLSQTLWLDQTQPNLLRKIAMVFIGVLALAISAKVQIAQVPVPITLQVLVVMSIGAAYGARMAGATLGAYLLAGLSGLPVFAGPIAGPLYFFGPTGGYLLGFFVAAVIVGALAERGFDRSPLTMLLAMAVGLVALYVPGVLWLTLGGNLFLGGEFGGYGLAHWYDYGVKTFIWVDAIKLLVAVAAFPLIWGWLGARR